MVGQVLRHLEALVATREGAFVEADGEVAFEMLSLL